MRAEFIFWAISFPQSKAKKNNNSKTEENKIIFPIVLGQSPGISPEGALPLCHRVNKMPTWRPLVKEGARSWLVPQHTHALKGVV